MATRRGNMKRRSRAQGAAGDPKGRAARGRVPIHLVPPVAWVYTAMVMALGAQKYGPYNWRASRTRVRATVYGAAALRHLLQWLDGHDEDAESRVSHLAHVIACAAILLDAAAVGRLEDDRFAARTVAPLLQRFQRALRRGGRA